MPTVTFTVPGDPVAKARPRVTMAGGKPRAYTPSKTAGYEAAVALASEGSRPDEVIDGPVFVGVVAIFRRPKRLQRRKDPGSLIAHTKRPDLDNVVKAVLDGLDHWWRDDAQVFHVDASKYYAERTGTPRCIVTVHYGADVEGVLAAEAQS